MAGTLQQFENDPRFKSLPYYYQQLMRSKWVEANLAKDAKFQSLPLQLQTKMVSDIIGAAPKFSTPEAQAYFDKSEEERKASGKTFGGLQQLAQFTTSMYQGSSIARLATYVSSKLMEAMPGVYGNPSDTMKGAVRMLWNREDNDKMTDYYRSIFDDDFRNLNNLNFASQVGGIIGTLADTAVMYQGFGTPMNPEGIMKPILNGIDNSAAKIASAFGKSARIGNWVAKTALPNVLHGLVAGGSIQAVRETIGEALNEVGQRPDFRKIATVAAKAYGAGALGDILWFAATAPIAATAKAVKQIVFAKKASAFLKDLHIDQKDFKDVMKSFMAGEHIDRNIISRMKEIAPETAQKLLVFENHFITLKNFERIDPNSPSLKKVDAFRKGWEADVDVTGKWNLKHLYDPSIKMDFADDAALMKFLDAPASDWMDALTKAQRFTLNKATTQHQQMIRSLEGSTVGAINDNYYVRQQIKSKLGQDDASLSTVQANLLKPVEGKLNDANLVQAARLWLKRKGVKDWDTVKIGAGLDDPGGYDLFIKRPANIGSARSELEFVRSFVERVDSFGGRKLASVRASATPAEIAQYQRMAGAPVTGKGADFDQFLLEKAKKTGKEFSRAYYRLVGYTDSWAAYSAKKMGLQLTKTSKGYDLIDINTKDLVHYNDFNSVVRELLIRSDDFHAIHASLREQGIILATDVNPDTGITTYYAKRALGSVVGPDKKMQRFIEVDVSKNQTRANVISKNTDLRALLDEIGYQPKASSFLGPQLTYVSPDFSEITYIRNIAVGNYQTTLRHLSSFRNKEKKPLTFISQGKEGTIYLDGSTATYEVLIPEIGYRKTFASVAEAKTWMQRGFRVYDVLDQIADSKGYKIEVGKGGWYVWNDNNQYFARNFDELKKVLEQAPLPEWSPELFGQKPPTYGPMNPKVEEGMFRPEVFDPNRAPKAKPLLHTSHVWKPLDSWIDDAIIGGLEKEVATDFRAVELGRRSSHSDDIRVMQTINTIFEDPAHHGKLVSDDVMTRVFNYMDAYGPDKPKVIAQYLDMGKPLEDWEIRIADTASDFLSSGMEKYGVPRELRVMDYISHIRQMGKTEIDKLFRGTTEEILKRTGAKRQIFEFFKNARKDDIMLLAKDTNALSVMQKYFSVGNRALHMGSSIAKLKAWANKVASSSESTPVQKTAAWRVATYVDDVMGINTPFEEMVRQGLIEMGQKIGLKNPDVMKSFYSAAYSFSYLVNMGWRPWSAVRNFFQIWTTLGPRFGNANTARAMEYVMKHPAEVIDLLKSKGLILEQLPLYGSELLNPKSVLSKLTYKGLSMFKNAEDLTRAIAWATAKIQWDDALKVFSAAKASGKSLDLVSSQFMDVSGASMIGPSIKREVLTHLRKNDWASAFDAYSQGVIEETMFSYQSGLSPTAYRGVAGRAFGTFGVYPVWFVQNIKRGLTQGSVMNRIGFASRFVGNGLALFGGFAAMGVNAKDFLPWVPLQFSGGPYYKFANKLLQATGSDYAGRQARGELKRELPRLLLPASQINNLKNAIEHLDSGNFTEAVASILSVPVLSPK